MKYNYEVEREIGIVSENESKRKQLRLDVMSWNGTPAKYNLRIWLNGEPAKGVTMTRDELESLYELVKDELNL